MYTEVNGLRMTSYEAAGLYPDYYIIMQWDSRDPVNQTGTVYCVGDDEEEIMELLFERFDLPNCGVLEGENLRRCLGGVVTVG